MREFKISLLVFMRPMLINRILGVQTKHIFNLDFKYINKKFCIFTPVVIFW